MWNTKLTYAIAAAIAMLAMLSMPAMAGSTSTSPCITQGEGVSHQGSTESEEPDAQVPENGGDASMDMEQETLVQDNEVQETEAAAQPIYSAEELDVLAHALCGEAQNYPDQEQLYVGSVILNRKNHSAYPNTVKGVVFQKGQYACTWDGNYYRRPTDANYRNARWLLDNGSILPGNVVYQASFKQGSGIYLQTKYHKYCYR